MNAIAIIPARGGSKRIPRKNIRSFLGEPIISYPIRKALESNLFSRVIVSTDDTEVARVAKEYGAETSARPSNLSGDYTSLTEVVQYEVGRLKQSENEVCCILATALFFTQGDLLKGKALLETPRTLFSLPSQHFPAPIERAFTVNEHGGTQMVDSSKYFTRSQDCLTSYFDAGQFYWGWKSGWADPPENFFGDHTKSFELENKFCVDIDEASDWLIAERLFATLQL